MGIKRYELESDSELVAKEWKEVVFSCWLNYEVGLG